MPCDDLMGSEFLLTDWSGIDHLRGLAENDTALGAKQLFGLDICRCVCLCLCVCTHTYIMAEFSLNYIRLIFSMWNNAMVKIRIES